MKRPLTAIEISMEKLKRQAFANSIGNMDKPPNDAEKKKYIKDLKLIGLDKDVELEIENLIRNF